MIKEHIISNFKDDSIDEIINAIESSVNEDDEITLPGLGVFLSLIWKDIDNSLKKELATVIKNKLKSFN